MSDTLVPITFVKPDEGPSTCNTLLYGPPGSGKTTAALTAPAPTLVINAEGPNALRFARSRSEDVREVTFEGAQTLNQVLDYIKTNEGADVRTVVIDSVAAIHRIILEAIGGQNPQIQHYGQVNNDIARLVRRLRDLPVNTVFICHEQIDDDPDSGRIVRPLTGGQKLPEIIMGEVDVVAYCSPVQQKDAPPKYMGQLVDGRGRRAKDRSGALGVVRDLDLTEWLHVYTAALAPSLADVPWTEEARAILDAEDVAA